MKRFYASLMALLLFVSFACQAAVYSLPWGPKPQFVDANGAPMSGGSLLTFIATSTTPQVTYTDSTGGVANPTTITLNTRGETPNEVWLTGGVSYKFVLKDSSGSTIWTVDGVSGVNDVSASVSEWIAGPTPTYVSATQFTLAGDQTTTFTIGRRLKFTVSAGTVYGRITASAFAASTTVTVQMDGAQVLDSGLSVVNYALLAANVKSEPERIATAAGTDTYTATVGLARLVIGDEYKVKIANANTSTVPTLNLDSLGAKTILRLDGTAIFPGDLNGEHVFRWNGTNMIVLNAGTSGGIPWAAAGGTGNAITATYAPAITTLYDGLLVGFRASGGNSSTTPTFSPNGLTARTITRFGGSALAVQDINTVASEVLIRYNLANTRWEMLNPANTLSGTFTATLTGCTAGTTVTATWYKTTNTVTVHYPPLSCTSNTAAATVTGQPTDLQPATAHSAMTCITQDNSATPVVSRCDISTGGVITLYNGQTTVFTAANVKGLPGGLSLTYGLD